MRREGRGQKSHAVARNGAFSQEIFVHQESTLSSCLLSSPFISFLFASISEAAARTPKLVLNALRSFAQ